jgi:spermidine synthase
MKLKEYLWPVTVARYKSEFNQEVEVVRFMGEYRLDMGQLTQSGDIIRRIWGKALKRLLPPRFSPQKVLILGLGAGSVAEVIAKRWKEASITGVEIDPTVIKIGRKYFSLNKLANLRLVNADAVEFVEGLGSQKFDLILVDCYQGHQIPGNLQTLAFARKLKNHGEHVLFNRLFWDVHKPVSLRFMAKLGRGFTVASCRTPSNLVLGI